MLTGHPTGKTTLEYLQEVMFEGIPSHVRKTATKHSKHWPDGTRRLIPSDLSAQDLATFTHYTDLCRFDKHGDYILELCIAYHEDFLDRRQQKWFSKLSRMVPHQPRNPVVETAPDIEEMKEQFKAGEIGVEHFLEVMGVGAEEVTDAASA
jgi:hypothetical protein